MIREHAITVLEIEAQSILNLTQKIGASFEALVNAICDTKGRVIVSGIGKSGLIGRKIAATLSSTGTNAMFLHPVEAVHGDLGMVAKEDVVIAISNSGETAELNQLLPVIRNIGCLLAGFTGKPCSTMAGFCDLVIDTGVEKEACPLNMAPTSSTTAQLAMGDALAVALIHKKEFKESDFLKSHPGGALGQRLSCRVEQLMSGTENLPCVASGSSLSSALSVMDAHRVGAVMVTDKDTALCGIITDGDIRHLAASSPEGFGGMPVESVMTKDPRSLSPSAYLYDALNLMEKFQITVLPVVNDDKKLVGMLHLHDILGKGSFKYNGATQ